MAIANRPKIFVCKAMLAAVMAIALFSAIASVAAKLNEPHSSLSLANTDSFVNLDSTKAYLAAVDVAPNLEVPQLVQMRNGAAETDTKPVLTTLQVRNIQVRAEWNILGAAAKQFTVIEKNSSEGLLSVQASLQVGKYTVGIEVIDKFSYLNKQYTDLSVAATIIVEVLSIPLRNAASPTVAITVIENYAQTISTYTFQVTGGFGDKTYDFSGANGFAVDAQSGSLSFDGTGAAGVYVLTVWADDEASEAIALLLTAKISAALSGISTDSIQAPISLTVNLRGVVFSPTGGILPYTFILTDNSDNFAIDTDGENFRITLAFDRETTATVGWRLDDADARTPPVTGRVAINIVAGVVFLQPVAELNITAGVLAKEAIFTAQATGGQTLAGGGYTYTQIGTDPHFTVSISEAAAGARVFMLSAVAQAGTLTLTIQAMDGMSTKAILELRLFIYDELSSSLAAGFIHTIFVDEQSALGAMVVMGGSGDYQYALMPTLAGFAINDHGELAIDAGVAAGIYTLRAKALDVNLSSWHAVVETITLFVSVAEGVYVLGGNDVSVSARKNDIWYGGGKAWTQRTAAAAWSARGNHQAAALNGRLYVLGGIDSGGYKNDVWSSLGGKIWHLETESAAWSARYGHQALSHQGLLFVLAGDIGGSYKNDVWQSMDGENWNSATEQAAWTGRWYPAAVSHNNNLYILGGHDDGSSDMFQFAQNMNDVWRSADGKQWTLITAEAAWSKRRGHQAVAHQGRIFILGGTDGINGTYKNDVWSSLDGNIWRLETAAAAWLPRAYHAAASHNGILYVFGGGQSSDQNINDVWSSADGKQWTREADGAEWDKNGLAAAVFPPDLTILGVSELLSIPATHSGILYNFSAKHGDGDYSYSLLSPANGFVIDANGELSATGGTADAGRRTLRVQVQDGSGKTAETEVAALLTAPLTLSGVTVTAAAKANGITWLHTFDAGDGSVYSIIAGDAYFEIDRASGEWSALAETPAGIYTLTIEAAYYFSVSGIMPEKATVAVVVNMQVASPPIARMIYIFGGDDGDALDSHKQPDNSGKLLGDIVHGKDGDWRRVLLTAPWSARRAFQAIAHRGSLYVMGGYEAPGKYANDVWATSNGTNWVLLTTAAAWSARYGLQAASHNGSLFILGGNDNPSVIPNDVWVLAGGKDWQMVGSMPRLSDEQGGRLHHRVLSHGGRLFVLGGIDGVDRNDVWSSADGKVWREDKEDNNAEDEDNVGWLARRKHGAVLHNGKMYILGGFGVLADGISLGYKNDVWSSADGQAWVEETAAAEWSARSEHQTVSLGDKIYVLGGIGESGNAGDVWSSADGKTWTQEVMDPDLWGRNRFAAEVFPVDDE